MCACVRILGGCGDYPTPGFRVPKNVARRRCMNFHSGEVFICVSSSPACSADACFRFTVEFFLVKGVTLGEGVLRADFVRAG